MTATEADRGQGVVTVTSEVSGTPLLWANPRDWLWWHSLKTRTLDEANLIRFTILTSVEVLLKTTAAGFSGLPAGYWAWAGRERIRYSVK